MARNNNTEGQTNRQIADRYIATQEVFAALRAGRHISMLDALEFKVCEMHTVICNIRRSIINKNLPWIMKDRWIESGTSGKKCKEYWLEPTEEENAA